MRKMPKIRSVQFNEIIKDIDTCNNLSKYWYNTVLLPICSTLAWKTIAHTNQKKTTEAKQKKSRKCVTSFRKSSRKFGSKLFKIISFRCSFLGIINTTATKLRLCWNWLDVFFIWILIWIALTSYSWKMNEIQVRTFYYESLIVGNPSLPDGTKFSKRGGLDRTSTFRGGLLGKWGVTFLRGVTIFT